MLSKRYRIFVLLILLLVTARLYADGCFVWNKGADLTEPSQKAIIYFKDGSEVLVLQVKYEGPAEDFAWIVPLPAKPEVAAIDADKSPFAEISLYTQYRKRWGLKGRPGVDAEETVTVLERKIVGVYDIAVLSASDAAALNKWLNKNGYAFPAERKDVLEHYTKKKWVYVAMRIDRKALESDEVKKLKTGELQPIRFTFATKEMVYPLKISSVNAGETEVLLYLLADVPMVVKSGHMRAGLSIEENIPYAIHSYSKRYWDAEYGTFRKVACGELPLTWEALGVPKDVELSLCRYRSVYKVEEMTDDLVFERFEPIPYWKEQFHKQREKSYWNERQKVIAISVLAYHDPNVFCSLAREQDKRVRGFIASYPATPKQVLLELAHDEEVSVRLQLLHNKNISMDLLGELVHDQEVSVRLQLVRNRNISVDLLGELAKDKEKEVRLAVLRHPKTSVDTFRKLAEDKSQDIRGFIASSKRTPVDVLCKLAGDDSAKVRGRVVFNPNTPADVFRTLAEDREQSIQLALAGNPYVPSDVLGKLAESKNEDVRYRVALRETTPVDILKKLARDGSPKVRMRVGYNPNAPKELLEDLARDGNQDVRAMVAANGNAGTRILRKLAKDNISVVRRAVAHNSNTPQKLLEELACDESQDVRSEVAGNPKTPTDALLRLAEDKDAQVRIGAASNRNMPVEVLRRLAKDEYVFVRWGVAENPNTPEDVLRILAEDKDQGIRALVRSALETRGL